MPQGSDDPSAVSAEVAAPATTSALTADGRAAGGARQAPGQPEREKVAQPPVEGVPGTGRRKKRRRAVRSGTNPSAEDLPDVVPPREEPAPGESAHERWLREQRPPHWE